MRSMPAILSLAATLVLATAALGAPGQVRTLEESYAAGELGEVRLEVSVGEVEIIGTDGDRVEVEVRVRCGSGWGSSSCEDRAEDVEIDADRSGDRLRLQIEGPGMWGSRSMHLDVVVRLPARLGVDLEMSVGEVAVRDVEGDVAVDLGIGEVSLRMAEERIASLSLDTGIGESSLRAPSRRQDSAGLFTRAIDWDPDRGPARVRIELGIGEIDVRLS